MSEETTLLPWKNGYYYNENLSGIITKMEGNTALMYLMGMKLDFPDADPLFAPDTWTYGDYGPAIETISKASGGIKNYNVKISMWSGIEFHVCHI